VADLGSRYRPHLESLLEPGEELRGLCVYAGIMDHAAVQLEIRRTAGGKLKLMMMRGEGGLLGKLGGR